MDAAVLDHLVEAQLHPVGTERSRRHTQSVLRLYAIVKMSSRRSGIVLSFIYHQEPILGAN